MRNIETVISNLKLDVSAIKDVPESYSSEVYKLELANGEIVYAKIPYNRGRSRTVRVSCIWIFVRETYSYMMGKLPASLILKARAGALRRSILRR